MLIKVGVGHGKPLVAVIGWLGCQPRHLAKYESLWHSLGCQTLTYIPPLQTVLSTQAARNSVHAFLHQTRWTHRIREAHAFPLLHLFSGNGVNFAASMLRFGPSAAAFDAVHGCIVDSAPPRLSAHRYAAGLGPALGRNLPAPLKPLMTATVERVMTQYIRYSGVKERYETLRSEYIRRMGRVPHIFMYSDTDDVIPQDEVEEFITDFEHANASLGSKLRIERALFHGTEHVAHYRGQPQKYQQRIVDFVNSLS
jgi:hypothetical protein